MIHRKTYGESRNEVCSNDAIAHRRRGGLPLGPCKRGSACRTIRSCMAGSPAVASDNSFESLKPIFRRSLFPVGMLLRGRPLMSVCTDTRSPMRAVTVRQLGSWQFDGAFIRVLVCDALISRTNE